MNESSKMHELKQAQLTRLVKNGIVCYRCGGQFRLNDKIVCRHRRRRVAIGCVVKVYHEKCWQSTFFDSADCEGHECAWFGHAGWSANPNDKDLPFEYCKDCLRQEECKNKDLGNQEEAAFESAYDQMYGQEAEQE